MKTLSEFGFTALDRLDKKTDDFCDDKIDFPKMSGIAKSGNTTARLMDSTLRVKKFDVAVAAVR